ALLPLLAVWGYVFDGLFIGATRAREMRNAMLIAAAIFALTAWGLRPWGNHGLWLAFLAFTVARGGIMAWMAWRITRRQAWMIASSA
ncbi:MAG: MATE family efflux transporter, partial [Xanthomonadales bacterium]|nr:MATE family efflux transporter [Xanthomonadales bacterium]